MSPGLTVKMRSAIVTLAAIVAATTGLAGCTGKDRPGLISPAVVEGNQDGFNGTVVDPPLQAAAVVLNDTNGARFDLARPAADKVTALFFGFTNCDDVCPTTMADLAAGRRSLPPALAEKVTVVFVTVDPDRDTPAVLERWLGRFDPDFIGLRGPTPLVHQAERSLYAIESDTASAPTDARHTGDHAQSTNDETGYEVSHSGTVYVFGPGKKSLIYTGGTTAQEYAEDFTALLTT